MKSLNKKPRVIAIIVAAGRGSRFGGERPKQYAEINGKTVLRHTLEAFLGHPDIYQVVPVIHGDDQAFYGQVVHEITSKKLGAAQIGGATRQASVLLGLKFIKQADIILIHDAARPFVSVELITRAIAAARDHGAAVPALPVTDTLIKSHQEKRTGSVDRQALRAVQTPQAFHFDLIREAHERAAKRPDQDHTDDGSVAGAAGHAVHIFDGEHGNIKITTQDDLLATTQRLSQSERMISRTATGFDVHAFGEGDHVWLCGLKIPHTSGFIAHSDGDVALHAITDALLGAMADGDIGRHFPPSDNKWKGASSDQFLAFAAERLKNRGGVIDLLDVTIICESPKIGPHSDAMCQRVADIVGISIGAVSVKATTTERLGFTGRKEGISALATATIRLPLSAG